MILIQAITAHGEWVDRIFPDKQSVCQYAYTQAVTIISTKTISFHAMKIKKLMLTLCTQLKNNLGLHSNLAESVSYLKDNTTDNLQRCIYNEIFCHLQAGKSFFQALKLTQIPFPNTRLKLIAQGEESNCLRKTLSLIAEEIQSDLDNSKTLRKSLTYPSVLLFSCYLFIHFVLLNLIPNILSLYENIGKMAPSWLHTLNQPWTCLITVDLLLLTLTLMPMLPVFPSAKQFIKQTLSSLPIVRDIILRKNRLDWLQGFLIEHKTRPLLLTAFESAIDCVTLRPLRQALYSSCQQIKNGSSPAETLQATQLFPANWVLTFQTGEKNHNLNALCDELLQQESQQLQDKLKFLTSLIEPITLLFMGGVVLFLIVTLYAPLLTMYGATNI